MSRLDFGSIIVTVILVCASVVCAYYVFYANSFPDMSDVKIMSFALFAITGIMVFGCIAKYLDYSREDLEDIADTHH